MTYNVFGGTLNLALSICLQQMELNSGMHDTRRQCFKEQVCRVTVDSAAFTMKANVSELQSGCGLVCVGCAADAGRGTIRTLSSKPHSLFPALTTFHCR